LDKLRARGSHNFACLLCVGSDAYLWKYTRRPCFHRLAYADCVALAVDSTRRRETAQSGVVMRRAMYCSTQAFRVTERDSCAAATSNALSSLNRRASPVRFDFVLHTPRARDVQLTLVGWLLRTRGTLCRVVRILLHFLYRNRENSPVFFLATTKS
jgi:hypothetical protein